MIYTLMLGAPVSKEGDEFGSLTTIIVDNGIANQIVVNPSGLFAGPDRVVPINAIAESSAEGITLNATDVDWHSYGAYNVEQYRDHRGCPAEFPAFGIDLRHPTQDLWTARRPRCAVTRRSFP